MTHLTMTPPATTHPKCGRCPKPMNVTYLADSDHPIPRCWDHAPSLPEAIARGWVSPTGVDHRDRRP